MRYSIYNTILRVSPAYGLLYNALSDEYIVLKNEPFEILQSTDANALQSSSPSLHQQLFDAKAIVADDTDEVDRCVPSYAVWTRTIPVFICMSIRR